MEKPPDWVSWNKWLKCYTTSFPLSAGRCSHSKSVSSLLASTVSLDRKKLYLGVTAQRLRLSELQALEKGKLTETSLGSFWDTYTCKKKTPRRQFLNKMWRFVVGSFHKSQTGRNGSAEVGRKHCGDVSPFHQRLWGQLQCHPFPPHQNGVWTLSQLNLFLTNPD